MERKREINVDILSDEVIESLSVQIGDRIREICDNAVLEANKILNIYGMSAKMAIEFNTLEKNKPSEDNQEQS